MARSNQRILYLLQNRFPTQRLIFRPCAADITSHHIRSLSYADHTARSLPQRTRLMPGLVRSMDTNNFFLDSDQYNITDWLTFESPQLLDEDIGHASLQPTLRIAKQSKVDAETILETTKLSTNPGTEKGTFKLIWPEEGQILPKLHPRRKIVPRTEQISTSTSTSPTSSPDASPIDSHNEASCSKCRFTEAEARKCRVDRRREQNRASQRKFRARKEAKIRDAVSQVATLEAYVEFLEKQNEDLETSNAIVVQKLERLERSSAQANDHGSLLFPGGGPFGWIDSS